MLDTTNAATAYKESDTPALTPTSPETTPATVDLPRIEVPILDEPVSVQEDAVEYMVAKRKRLNASWLANRELLMPTAWGLGMTAIASLIAFVLSYFAVNTVPFVLYLAAVTIATWRGGMKAGLVAAFVSGVIVSYLFLPAATLLGSFVTMGQFLLVSVLIAFIVDATTNATKIAMLTKELNKQSQKLISLKDVLSQTQEEVKARDEFLSIVSHELKTPLTSMLLQLQIALHNIRNVSLANFSVENLMRMLQSAEDQTVRLSKMINDLLNVSLITTGRLDLNRQEIDLSYIVRGVFENFSERFVQKGYHVNLALDDGVIGTWDKIRIEQAVTNLISNAIKYGDGKPITIVVQRRGNQAVFLIQDQGIGIAKDVQKRIFDRFERGVSASEFKGLGVGLYITNQIVKAHGGSIAVKSSPGDGATFIAKLPLNGAIEVVAH